MREIKFRVYDSRTPNPRMYYFSFEEMSGLDDSWFGDDFIWQQYTGLKDKNSKEIYEGDIVKQTDPRLKGRGDWYEEFYEIKFEDGCFMAVFGKGKNYCAEPVARYLEYPEYSDVEIIGNIYENPELLGDKK